MTTTDARKRHAEHVAKAAAASSARPAEAIVGDWTGETTSPADAAAADLAHLRRRVRAIHVEALRRRQLWAKSNTPGSIERAVAYQSMASLLQNAIEDNERRGE